MQRAFMCSRRGIVCVQGKGRKVNEMLRCGRCRRSIKLGMKSFLNLECSRPAFCTSSLSPFPPADIARLVDRAQTQGPLCSHPKKENLSCGMRRRQQAAKSRTRRATPQHNFPVLIMGFMTMCTLWSPAAIKLRADGTCACTDTTASSLSSQHPRV